MPSTYKNKFNKKMNLPLQMSHSIKDISKLSGYDSKGLTTIFQKGQGAFFSNKSSVRPHVKSAQEWGMSRVYAAIDKSSKAYKIDKSHLVKKK